jgi:hypothetical protein
MLLNLNSIIVDCLDSTTRNTNRFLDSLSVVSQTVQDNLAELNAQPEMPPQEEMAPAMQEAEPPSIFDNPEDGSLQ